MKVKICGITKLEDALLAIDLGASALGFNFYNKSKRYISPEIAQKIIEKLPLDTETVGVFVNENYEKVSKIHALTNIKTLQFHGTESLRYCQEFKAPFIKALHLNSKSDISLVKKFGPFCRVLIDAPDLINFGGTGTLANLELAKKAQEISPIILAGGLSSSNLSDIITYVAPNYIDLCSSIEVDGKPGLKDHTKMKNLFKTLESIIR